MPERVALVTGFDPFGGERINPSWEIVKRLPASLGGWRVVKQRIPTDFQRMGGVLRSAILRTEPQVVLCLGQAGGRSAISVERVAINVADARIADNAGAQPIDAAIVKDGPAAYFATVPIKAMVVAISKAGLPAEVSNSAGTFLCNAALYVALHEAALRDGAFRAGFIHVPYLPVQAAQYPDAPSMALGDMVEGVTAALRAAFSRKRDVRLAAGTIA